MLGDESLNERGEVGIVHKLKGVSDGEHPAHLLETVGSADGGNGRADYERDGVGHGAYFAMQW